jgi:hypothetical protein
LRKSSSLKCHVRSRRRKRRDRSIGHNINQCNSTRGYHR